MYNKLYDEIKEIVKKNRYPSDYFIKEIYLNVLYIKYLIEEKKLITYEEALNEDSKYLFKKTNNSKIIIPYKFDIQPILLKIKDLNLKELLDDFLNSTYDNNNDILDLFFNKEDKILSIFKTFKLENYYFNKLNSDYKLVSSSISIDTIEILNEMLNINCKYNDKINDYNKIFIDYNTFLSTENEIIEYLYELIYKLENNQIIIIKTKYNKIYRLKNIILLKHLTKFIILNNNVKNSDVILVFNKQYNNNEITIGNVDNYNKEQIKKILSNDKQDYIINVPIESIKDNNYLLGFNFYKKKYTKKTKEIYEMVKNNTMLTDKLLRLNKIVEEEFNSLITK